MSDTARPKSAGDKFSADEINKDLPIVLNAGETINGATLPVALYVKAADGEVYACDGNDATALEFIGFAVSNSTDGNPITIQKNGVVSGFTGLTTGSRYYVQDDKTIGTTIGTYEVLVGIAISATQILIQKGSFEYIGTDSSSSQNPTFTAPSLARFAIATIGFVYGGGSMGYTTLLIARKGSTNPYGNVSASPTPQAQYETQVSANWSGSSITISGMTNTSPSTSIYYYK